jgi:hypothetical protein
VNEAEAVLFAIKVWATIGAFVALVFLVVGIDRIDEDARGAYIFRPLLVPGVIIIWPLVLWRWYVLETGKDSWFKRYMPVRNAHYITAWVLAVAVVATIIVGYMIRQSPPVNFEPQRLSLLEKNVA